MGNEANVGQNGSDNASEARERLDMLRDSAGKYGSRDIHLKRSRGLRGSSPGYDRQVWREMADLGWLGTLLPEKLGGMELTCAEMAVIAEALGRSLFPEPLVGVAVLAGGALLYGDNDALKSELLPAMAGGRMIPALAWREDGHAVDPLAVATRAEESSAGVKISGAKRLVIGGVGADGYIVTARNNKGIGLYWIPAGQAGVTTSTIELGDGRLAAEVKLSGVEVSRSHRVAAPGAGETALLRAYDEALVVTSAELLGVLSRAFEITLDYLRTRSQFGKLIGSFQALQHRAVDLYIEQRMCRHALDDVLTGLAAPGLAPEARGALASRIKARCSEASLHITREGVQLHGAIGFSDECDIGLYLKRAVTLAGWLGGADVHRRRYARLSPYEAAE